MFLTSRLKSSGFSDLVVETGVGFVLTVEFDKIKDIFAKKTEEFKIQERKAKKAQEEREVRQLEQKQNTVK